MITATRRCLASAVSHETCFHPNGAVPFCAASSAAFSMPGLILASAFVGFAGLAREAGLTLAETVFMTGVVWALPGKVVLVGAILSGASLPAAALAVALSSVRLMPMVVALVPEMRGRAHAEMGALRALAFRGGHLLGPRHGAPARRPARHAHELLFRPRLDAGARQHGRRGGRLPGCRRACRPVFGAPCCCSRRCISSPRSGVRRASGQGMSRWCSALSSARSSICSLPEFDLLAAGLIGGGAAYAVHRLSARRGAP